MFMGRRSWLKTTGLFAVDQLVPAAPEPAGRDSLAASKALAVAETGSGKVRGFVRHGIFTFGGIPYGASTAGGASYACRVRASRHWPRDARAAERRSRVLPFPSCNP